jgi:hypothetical protein
MIEITSIELSHHWDPPLAAVTFSDDSVVYLRKDQMDRMSIDATRSITKQGIKAVFGDEE